MENHLLVSRQEEWTLFVYQELCVSVPETELEEIGVSMQICGFGKN